jgi:hypothetical protein
MINPRDSFDFEYRDSYVTKVIIEQLADDETPTYHCELIEAFPIQVNSMPVNWGDDNFHRVTITMTYRYWTEGEFSREEAEKNIQDSIQSGNASTNARNNARRAKDAAELVSFRRNNGAGDRRTPISQTRNQIKIDTPEPGSGLGKPVQVDIQPPNFGVAASAVRTNIGPR